MGKPDAPSAAGVPHALLVEAEEALRHLCRGVLQRAGFLVIEATSGVAAIRSARARFPNLIVIGAQLPDVPGREAVEWLSSNPALHSTPMIILGRDGHDATDWSKFAGACFLRRPVSAETLTRAIARATPTHGSVPRA